MTADRPAVAVVGPGAIGTSVAAALHEAGVPV
ncbi:oxidoreductase, partial [Clavibacter californiensis]